MHEIGTVKLIQIQRSSLKTGERGQRVYDPSPLLVVSRLLLTPGGCIGITSTGEQIIDLHHQEHASSHNIGDNNISFGFTSHYQSMRDKFGPHLIDGCAGENILIETDKEEFSPEDLPDGIAIQNATTGELVRIRMLRVAPPCLPFSQFAAKNTPLLQVKEPLQFLHQGKRGFYAALASGQTPMEVMAEERVFAL